MLARSLASSALISALQSVPGVAAVDQDALEYDTGQPAVTLNDRLAAGPAAGSLAAIQPAGLLVLAADGFQITEMTP